MIKSKPYFTQKKKQIIPIIIYICFLLANLNAFATNNNPDDNSNDRRVGAIEGTVIDKKTGELIIGANVTIDGTTSGAVTDYKGHFEIHNLKPGVYNLKISYVSYAPVLYEGIAVEPVTSTQIKIELEESTLKINEVTVTAVRRTNTEISMISSIKTSPLVVTGISSQQILRSQDRDASEVVKRLPGITINDNRFIVVRGLNQRYNNVWLNNAATPSSETDVKAFSFDVIPSGMIDNIMIYKSGAPELPADFVGGFIKVNTKNMPDNNYFSIDLSSSYDPNVTFKDFKYYKGGKLDILGFDDGTRALPSGFPSHLDNIADNPTQIDNLAKQMNNNWAILNKKAMPGYKIGINFGKKFKLGGFNIGNTTSLTYSLTPEASDIENNAYISYNHISDKLEPRFTYNDETFTTNVKWGILHNWSFFPGNGQKIEFRNLFNQIGFSKTTIRNGEDYSAGTTPDIMRSYEESFMSRSMYSGQLAGEHNFNEGVSKLDWNIGYSFANRLEPDRKIFTSKFDDVSQKYLTILPTSANPKSCGHLYLDNAENIYSSGLNYEKKLTFHTFEPTIKTGYYLEYKNREFNARNIGFVEGKNFINNDESIIESLLSLPMDKLFAPENIDYYNKITLSEYTHKSDSYKADNTNISGYLGLNLPFTKKLNLYGGVRIEKNRMTVHTFEQGSSKPIFVDNNKVNFFPSANLSYKFSDKTLVRFAYYNSINRPEFREIAKLVYYDFNQNASITGNPNLKNASVQNIDLRFEYYPSNGETFSVAYFYKNFSNPIEMIYNEEGSGLAYTFKNAKCAINQGVELELKKSLDFSDALKNWSILLNGSLINSKVSFESDSITAKTNKNRPLYGQSPYILNAGLYYDNPDAGAMASILYNVIGERIYAVGKINTVSSEIPDIYESPRNMIDFTISQKIGKRFELKGGVKNILNAPVQYKQTYKYYKNSDINNPSEDRTAIDKKYVTGRIFTLGLTIKL